MKPTIDFRAIPWISACREAERLKYSTYPYTKFYTCWLVGRFADADVGSYHYVPANQSP